MRMHALAFVALLLFSVGTVNAIACPLGNICVCGTNISSPGEYNVTNDLFGASVSSAPQAGLACIRVSVSDVKINCAGHTLTNNVNGTTQGILVEDPSGGPISNVTIQGCGITNYTDGVGLQSLSGGHVSGVQASGNANGISVAGGSGNVLSSNNATNNTADGFLLTSTFANVLSGNNADLNVNDGFDLVGSILNNLTGNSASFNNQTGFYAGSLASGNIFRLNTAHDNQQNGFYVDTSSVLLDRNTAFQNLQDGFLLETSFVSNVTGGSAYSNGRDGYELVDSGANRLIGVTSHDNSNDGVRMWQGSFQNGLESSTAFNNGANGFEVGCCNSNNNILKSDTAHDNGQNGFLVSSSSGNAIDGGLAYGQTFGDGFQIFANIAASSNNITNSAAHDNNVGFEVTGDDNDYLFNNVAHNNHFAGFELDQSAFQNTLVHNTAYNNTNPIEGCFFFGNPQSAGFIIDSSSDNMLVNNTAYDNKFLCSLFPTSVSSLGPQFISTPVPTGHGFFVSSSFNLADNNNLTGNTAHDNGVAGFAEDNQQFGTNNLYADSLSYNNLYGFSLIQDDSDILQNVTAHSNSVAGFYENGVTSGSNNALINASRFYGNGWDIVQNSTNDLQFTILGTMVGNVNISLSDFPCCTAGYSINESGAMGHPQVSGNLASFRGKYLKVFFQASDESIDELDYHWTPGEAAGYNESSMVLLTWNGTAWVQDASQALDTGAHSLNTTSLVNITSDDLYGLFAQTNSTTVPGGNPSTGSTLGVSMASNCSGNVVTVSSGGPVQGADVLVDGNSIGTTDQNGMASFQGCGSSVTLRAIKSGFQDGVTSAQEIACGQCAAPKCTTDADCASDQKCQINDNASLNQCVLISCPCGQTASDHQCTGTVWQCGTGPNCGSCPTGQTCNADHQCVQTGCTSDLQCHDNEVCRTSSGAPGTNDNPGSCKPLCADGSNSCQCSQAENHTLVPLGYECGTEAGCSSCPSGQSCVDHKCIQNDINCPSSVVVGDNANCTLTQNNQACGPNDNCTTVVTTPDGRNVTLVPDENGNVQVPGSISGRVKVQLLKNGQVVKEVFIDVVPKSQSGEQPPPTSAGGGDLFSLLWLLLLLLIVVGAVVYWRSRGQKR